IEYVLADSGARVVFTDDRHAPVLERIGARGAGPRAVRAGAELDGLLDAIRLRPLDLDTPAGGNMIYTSGTTGRPKGVKRAAPPTVRDALVGHTKSGHAARLDGRGPHLITGPMYHAAPLMFAVYDNANGAPIVIMPRWDEREALELIAGREVAHVHLVPTMFVRLLRLPDAERAAFRAPSLRMALHGAAPISVAVKRRMIEWWGPVLVEYWGGTEGGVNTLIDSEDWLAHPSSVGRALPAFEIFAVDEAGRRLGPGETGDLLLGRAGSPDRKVGETFGGDGVLKGLQQRRLRSHAIVGTADRAKGTDSYPISATFVAEQRPVGPEGEHVAGRVLSHHGRARAGDDDYGVAPLSVGVENGLEIAGNDGALRGDLGTERGGHFARGISDARDARPHRLADGALRHQLAGK
ncbi:MAG TPA: AMP-binding protein, partial [Myxococcota bacterium]|nr:AMP-binding protein [Myxococcota bacterium]